MISGGFVLWEFIPSLNLMTSEGLPDPTPGCESSTGPNLPSGTSMKLLEAFAGHGLSQDGRDHVNEKGGSVGINESL